MPGRLEFEFPMTKEQSSPRYRAEEPRPMRIAFLGDFSGRAGRPDDPAEVPLSERRPLHVDVDGFESVLRRLQPRLRLERHGAAGPAADEASASYYPLLVTEDGTAQWLQATAVRHPAGTEVRLQLRSPNGEITTATAQRYDWSHAGGSVVLVAPEPLRGRESVVLDGRTVPIPEVLR